MKNIKKMLSKVTEKTIAIFMAISLLANNFMPIISVLAATFDETKDYSTYYQIQLNSFNNINISADDTNAVITYEHGRASINGEDLTINGNTLYSSTNMVVENVTPSSNDYDYQLWYDGSNITLATLNSNLSSLGQNQRKNVDFEFEQKQSGKITFNNATSISGSETSMTVSYEHGSATVTGVDLLTSSDDGGKYIYSYSLPQTLSITATADDGYQSRIDGNLATTYNQILNPNGSVNLNIDFENNNGGGNEPQTNKTATVNLTYTTGEYTYTAVDENGNESTKTDTYADGSDFDKEASIQVNGFRYEPNTTLNYNVEEGQTTATFNFSTLWHLKFYDSIIINGTTYNVSNYLDYDNQKAWLDHYDGQIVGFDIPNVPVADTYNITVKVGRQGKHHIANFLWTGDSRQSDRDNYIGNAHLEMIGLEYTVGGTKYTYTEDDFKSGSFDKDYVEYDSDESLKYDEGSLVVPAGSTITMRITPKYGYQVLSTNFAQSGITTTDDGVSEFTFTIGGGAAYFKADVVQVDDVVNAESEKVSSGSIELADGILETGTARLTVSDVDLDSSKITDFEEAAGEYNIKSYLDIDLDNVWYRGTADSVWSEKKHELSDYAKITLKLADGVDGNDIVIVHNINDGDEFEVIQIDSYDPETNTITFRTKSFSNFAIASKTTATTETTTTDTTTTSNPQTGDNLRMYINLFILSAGGLAIATLQLKKRKLAKNK